MVRRRLMKSRSRSVRRYKRKPYVSRSLGFNYTTRIKAVETQTADANGNVSLNFSLSRFWGCPMNTNLMLAFLEGRVNYYRVTFVPNTNLTNGALVTRGIFMAPFHGAYNPTVSNVTIVNLLGCKVFSPTDPNVKTMLWKKTNDPEESGFRPLNSALNFNNIGHIMVWIDGNFSAGTEVGQTIEEWGITYRCPRDE